MTIGELNQITRDHVAAERGPFRVLVSLPNTRYNELFTIVKVEVNDANQMIIEVRPLGA